MSSQELDDREKVFQMLNGYTISQPIYVVAKLGIPDLVSGAPRTPNELAESVGAHAPSVKRNLRTLASVGLFREREDGTFELTPMGES